MEAAQRRKVLLFVHGVRNDDPDRLWLRSLDGALRRLGVEDLATRGYEVRSPSYLHLLRGPAPDGVGPPAATWSRSSDGSHEEAAASFWTGIAELERTGIRGQVHEPRFARYLPATDGLAELIVPLVADANAYRSDERRRNAVLHAVLAEVPSDADLIIVAHSLGTVVAADLLYHLPRTAQLRGLITLGSPLTFRPVCESLKRHQHCFPFDVVGTWVNVAATRDPVTGYRGLSRFYPEPLDVFIESGELLPVRAHRAVSYLDDPVAATVIDWIDRRYEVTEPPTNSRDAPELLLPEALLSVVAGAQYAFHLERSLGPGDKRRRFAQARHVVIDSLVQALRQAGQQHSVVHRLDRDNGDLLRGRFSAAKALSILLTAHGQNVVHPFDIDLSDAVRGEALARLAADLGLASSHARAIAEAADEVRAAHRGRRGLTRAALAAAGVAAIVAAPMVVLAAAPAGLAGGAAIVGGLAALGPGGMMGGIGMVGLLGGAGGAFAAGALTMGSAAQVEANVIHLQALALVRHRLEIDLDHHPEWSALTVMEDAVTDEHARMSTFSDPGCDGIKELERKLKSIRCGLDWLADEGLGPEDVMAAVSGSV